MTHYITLDRREMLEQSSKFPVNTRPLLGLVFQFEFEEDFDTKEVRFVRFGVRNSEDTRWAYHTKPYLENFGLEGVLPAIQKQAEEFFHSFHNSDGCGNCKFAMGLHRNICDKLMGDCHGHLPKELTCSKWVRR